LAGKSANRKIAAAVIAGVGLGLLLAGVGIMGWWSLSARNQPLHVVNDPAPLEALLASAPYISLNRGERPVYVIAPRSAPRLEEWLLNDAIELAEQGREVRVIMVPSGHGGAAEDATVAELWLTQNIDLLAEWMSMRAEHWTAIGIEPVAVSPRRLAVRAEAAAFSRTLMERVGHGAKDDRWPLIIWRDGANQLAACLCQRPAAVNEARYALRLTGEGMARPLAPSPEPAPAYDDARPDEADDFDDRYPRLNYSEDPRVEWPEQSENSEGSEYRTPSPLLPGDVGAGISSETVQSRSERPAAAPRPQATRPQATRPRPAPRELNTAPPKAEKDAESLFY